MKYEIDITRTEKMTLTLEADSPEKAHRMAWDRCHSNAVVGWEPSDDLTEVLGVEDGERQYGESYCLVANCIFCEKAIFDEADHFSDEEASYCRSCYEECRTGTPTK